MLSFLNPRKNLKTVLFIIFIFFLIFTRFFNLDKTARFIWDESSDLVRMHQIFVEKKLTLVGPINESGDRVYSSLTYYMLLPFAILGNFDPVSPAWGAAFWGIITALLIVAISRKINPKYTTATALLTLAWFPLVETSRWAWNPNLIPFWSALGIFFFLRKTRLNLFLSGIFWGLTFHQHYLSFFSIIGFLVGLIILSIKEKQIIKPFIWSLGIIITLIPFILFDLRHPPGLFLTRVLYASPVESSSSITVIFNKAFVWLQYMLKYYTQATILGFILGFSSLVLLVLDIKTHSKGLLFATPWIAQIIGLIFIYNPGPIYYYYLLPSTVSFLAWVLYTRTNYSKLLANIILFILLLGGFFSVAPKLTQATWQTDIESVRQIDTILSSEIETRKLQNVNLAVLESIDNNTYGRRYRDLLLLQNIHLRTKDEYNLSDHLFVISTGTEDLLRQSPAFEMHNFRSGPLINSWTINHSNWKIYHFTRNTNTN